MLCGIILAAGLTHGQWQAFLGLDRGSSGQADRIATPPAALPDPVMARAPDLLRETAEVLSEIISAGQRYPSAPAERGVQTSARISTAQLPSRLHQLRQLIT